MIALTQKLILLKYGNKVETSFISGNKTYYNNGGGIRYARLKFSNPPDQLGISFPFVAGITHESRSSKSVIEIKNLFKPENEEKNSTRSYVVNGFSQAKFLTGSDERIYIANEKEIKTRDKELKDVLSSIIELNDMIQEFNKLVIEQGTILDRIDYNLENTEYQINEGVKNIIIAEQYQKCSFLSMCILILLLFFIILIICLLFKIVLKTLL